MNLSSFREDFQERHVVDFHKVTKVFEVAVYYFFSGMRQKYWACLVTGAAYRQMQSRSIGLMQKFCSQVIPTLNVPNGKPGLA